MEQIHLGLEQGHSTSHCFFFSFFLYMNYLHELPACRRTYSSNKSHKQQSIAALARNVLAA
jgi:hypothetical protein